MKSISTALSAALGAPVQKPAVLVEVSFFPVRRYSSFETVVWSGQTWLKEDISVDGLDVEALRLSGELTIGNADGAIASTLLTQGAQDRAIRIWGYDAAATGAADVVWLADAVGASVQIAEQFVRIQLRHPAELVLSPRTFVGEANFGTLLPAGSTLKINGRDYLLARRD